MSEFSPELTRAIEDYELRVSPDLKTVTGRLKYGIGVIDGEMHHDFAMHLLTVREDMEIDPQLEGQARLIAAYAASLDKLGGLTAESLTPDLLLDEMTAVLGARAAAKKAALPAPRADRYRYAVLKLGRYGITSAQIDGMTRPELEGWLMQADLIERGRAAPVVMPWFVPANLKPSAATGGQTQTFISKRKKK